MTSISYTAILGNKAKATLPSAEGWGTNMNIARDPPKSIMTRRVDKVNADGSLNDMYYGSGDRFSDSLTVYARGVNPMVSVQYTNSNGAPSKLPYRIVQNGAFRPPAKSAVDLLPFSRRPRGFVPVCAGKGWVDFTKTLSCARENEKFRQIKPEIIHPQGNSNIYFQIASPIKEHFTVKYVIEKPVLPQASTNVNSKANIIIQNEEHKRIQEFNPNRSQAYTNMHGRDKIEYIHEDIVLERNMPVAQATTNVSENKYITIQSDNEYQFERNMPMGTMTSNVSRQDMYVDNTSRDFSRAIKNHLVPGAIENTGIKPVVYHENAGRIERVNTTRNLLR